MIAIYNLSTTALRTARSSHVKSLESILVIQDYFHHIHVMDGHMVFQYRVSITVHFLD